MDTFDEPGRVVIEGDGDLAFEGADDPGSNVRSVKDGIYDKGGDVDDSVCVSG